MDDFAEQNVDLKLGKPFAHTHAGALTEWKTQKRMKYLLRKKYFEVHASNIILTYSFSVLIHLSGLKSSGLLTN